MKVVITIVGEDKVGIIARVSSILAEREANILNINQNIVDGFFNMVMIVDMTQVKCHLTDLQQLLKKEGEILGLDIRAQHEDIFKSMHTI
jgi:ACT domain-containing protein